MKARYSVALMTFLLSFAPPVSAQVVSGVMTVTGAEMHWWAGVARDATARLYDVHEDSVVLKKLFELKKYDQGTITFRAKEGKLIDLDKLWESIWATRLSGGTHSGVVSLEVTVVGEAVVSQKESIIRVAGSSEHFVLDKLADKKHEDAFEKLRAALSAGRRVTSVTGHVEGWTGRWPAVLSTPQPKPRRILVTSFETAEKRDDGSESKRESR